MPQHVFLLRHEREVEDCDHMIILGIFSSEALAREAQAYFETQRGFKDFPDGFLITDTRLNERMWSEGFVTWQDSLDTIKETP